MERMDNTINISIKKTEISPLCKEFVRMFIESDKETEGRCYSSYNIEKEFPFISKLFSLLTEKR